MDKVYWLELDKTQGGIKDLYAQWKPWLIKMQPDCQESREPWHCTIMYDEEGQNEEYEAMWVEHVARTQYTLKTIDLIVGPQGAAATVQLPKQLEQWYQIPDAAPHVSLMIGQACESKELGPMVKEESQVKQWTQVGQGVSVLPDRRFLKIRQEEIDDVKPQTVLINKAEKICSSCLPLAMEDNNTHTHDNHK
ncbi:hypothetical protein QTP86_016879, partial [Hemibagrus guttatus]